eukprot:12915519-Alexandrium_andersonii.AAC.1
MTSCWLAPCGANGASLRASHALSRRTSPSKWRPQGRSSASSPSSWRRSTTESASCPSSRTGATPFGWRLTRWLHDVLNTSTLERHRLRCSRASCTRTSTSKWPRPRMTRAALRPPWRC